MGAAATVTWLQSFAAQECRRKTPVQESPKPAMEEGGHRRANKLSSTQKVNWL